MTTFEVIQSVASIGTAVGVGLAALQLYLTKREPQSEFEDGSFDDLRTLLPEALRAN